MFPQLVESAFAIAGPSLISVPESSSRNPELHTKQLFQTNALVTGRMLQLRNWLAARCLVEVGNRSSSTNGRLKRSKKSIGGQLKCTLRYTRRGDVEL